MVNFMVKARDFFTKSTDFCAISKVVTVTVVIRRFKMIYSQFFVDGATSVYNIFHLKLVVAMDLVELKDIQFYQ